jgi:hypothetical protein
LTDESLTEESWTDESPTDESLGQLLKPSPGTSQ